MDPLADKLLVCSALICLSDVIPEWIVIVIISRELIISGFRTIAADNGVVIAASYWGKIKTVCQGADTPSVVIAALRSAPCGGAGAIRGFPVWLP